VILLPPISKRKVVGLLASRTVALKTCPWRGGLFFSLEPESEVDDPTGTMPESGEIEFILFYRSDKPMS
jgi:hypothetical protein